MAKQKSSILLVDDESQILDILQEYLESKGDFTVYRADNGRDAITIAGEVPVDLVLLDLMMPDMDGMSTLKVLKEMKPGLGVVIVSGLRDEELARETIKMGAHDYVVKPFDFNQLDLVLMTNIVMRPDAA